MTTHHIASYVRAMRDYTIRLTGHLDSRWATWFDGMTLTQHGDGTTLLEGPVVDQAALHGLLAKLRDLGLPILSITQTTPPSHQGD